MIGEWRSIMDNLSDAYYIVQLIVRQILVLLREFIFRELTWYTPSEENLDNTNSRIRAVSQHAIVDFLVFFVVCGLLFAFMILSAGSRKDEILNYETANTETIPMVFEHETSSFCFSKSTRSQLTRYFRICGDSTGPGNVIPDAHSISHPFMSRSRALPQSRILATSAYSSYSQHSRDRKTEKSHLASQTTPREWLIRRTRSGHIYGQYPI